MQQLNQRNELIANQEALLNVYRCLFNIDTQIVPDGCTDEKPAEGPDDDMTPEVLSPWEQLVYGDDPARLIAFADVVRSYTLGTDSWLVWSCDTPDGEWEFSPAELAERLEAWAQPDYMWLSDGAYVPEFIAAETVEADNEQDCLNKVPRFQCPHRDGWSGHCD